MNGILMTTGHAQPDSLDMFYGRLMVALADLKVRLQAQYECRFPGEGARIRDAIEKAEVAAWHTPFPHLFFPDLAEEAVGRLTVSSTSEVEDETASFVGIS